MSRGTGETARLANAGPGPIRCEIQSGVDRLLTFGICLFIALAVWIVFGQTRGYGFVNYDDSVYVYENGHVCEGLSWRGVEWAFTHPVNYNWHPLTMLSYMLDYRLHGLQAGGYHLTNVLLHGTAAILLFLVLRQMTAALWRSAFVAVLFAIHPLRVESVAWVAERKDVLSGLFFVLTLGAYVWYTRAPRRLFRYLTVMCCFALSLMSKPTVVPLPFVLLLLDYWPLKRFAAPADNAKSFCTRRWVILEKIPLLALSAATCLITFATQEKIIVPLPFSLRVSNAGVSYAIYLWQMMYPKNLAAYYPLKEQGLPLREITGAFLVLALVSVLAFGWWRKRPWLLVGWFWYLGMLVPVIGLVQSGLRAHADRYTYLPQIGLYVIVAWAVTECFAGRRHGRLLAGTLAAIVVAGLICCSRVQVSCWKDSRALWEHTLAVSGDTDVAHNNLGMDLFDRGQLDQAIAQYEQALKANPGYGEAHDNLGVALVKKGRLDEAIAQFQQALKVDPEDALAFNNLGMANAQQGKLEEAIARYQQALQINPDFDRAHSNLGLALVRLGRLSEAIAQYQQALRINPDAMTCNNLGLALAQQGKLDEAIAWYQQALQINPRLDVAHINLGAAFSDKGETDQAIAEYQAALKINPAWAPGYLKLGNACLNRGEVDQAIAQYQLALKIKPDWDMAHNDLGIAFDKNGQLDEAIAQFQQALTNNPDYALGHYNLGNVLFRQGKTDEAIAQYQQAVKADPGFDQAHVRLGYALLQKGRLDEVITHFERALEINPANAGQCNRLAWLLATHPQASVRSGAKAVELAQQLNQRSGGKEPVILETLAAAYAETGRFPEAVTTAQQAQQLAGNRGDTVLVHDLQRQIKGYQAGQPFRDTSLTNAPAFPRP